MSIKKSIRHLVRYREIVHVFSKNGFGYIIHRLGLHRIIPFVKECEKGSENCLAGRLRDALTELGPSFVKLGQFLSTRPDLLPPSYIQELENLQDRVPPFSYEQAVEQLVKEIGHPDVIFQEFDSTPLAAGSIGQVHLARLKTGEKVIVKIQRPAIEAQVENDLEILIGLARLAEKRSAFAKQVGLAAMMEDFAKLVIKELDYDREASNTDRMRRNFAKDERVVIPKIFLEYTTPRVLTEEFIDGVKFSNIEEVERRGWDRKKISALGSAAFLSQILEYGFFQVDPHQGNMLIIDEDHISFIDFGEVAVLSGRRLESLARLFTSINSQDIEGAISAFRDIGFVTESINEDDFRADFEYLVESVYQSNIGNIDIKQLQKDILDIAFRYQLKMPSYMSSLMKALVIVEGVGKKLDPTFNFTDIVATLAKRIVIERIKPNNLYQTAKRSYYRDIKPLISFPKNLNNLMKTTGEGNLTVKVQLGFSKEASFKMTQLINRLSISLLITGGLIGSALVLRMGEHPLAHYGYTIFGVIIFGFTFIGLLTVLAALRSK